MKCDKKAIELIAKLTKQLPYLAAFAQWLLSKAAPNERFDFCEWQNNKWHLCLINNDSQERFPGNTTVWFTLDMENDCLLWADKDGTACVRSEAWARRLRKHFAGITIGRYDGVARLGIRPTCNVEDYRPRRTKAA